MLDHLNKLSCYCYCNLYLFHFIVLLNPNFNCSKSFLSFSVDKVTTGTYNFVSFIWNSNPLGGTIAGLFPRAFLLVISAKTQFYDQVKINSTSQSINGIFKALQKLLKCFSGITIQFHFCQLFLQHNHLHHHQHYKYFL